MKSTCGKYEILLNPLMEFFEADSMIREELCDCNDWIFWVCTLKYLHKFVLCWIFSLVIRCDKLLLLKCSEFLSRRSTEQTYSHLSNKRGAHTYRFWKIPPSTKKSTLHVYWFLRFFPPSTPHLLELCISFFHKIPPSTFIPTSTFSY